MAFPLFQTQSAPRSTHTRHTSPSRKLWLLLPEHRPSCFRSGKVRAGVPEGKLQSTASKWAWPRAHRLRAGERASGWWLWVSAVSPCWRTNWPKEEVFKGPAVVICLLVTSGDRMINASVVSFGACTCYLVLLEFWLCSS